MVRKNCAEPGCEKGARDKSGKCKAHGGGGGKKCAEPGCEKNARDKTGKCIAHGGGKKCAEPGCEKNARDKTGKCIAHGGGKCVEPGCEKSAQGKTDKCKAHGGGKKCVEPGCEKNARDKTGKCKAHGGGKCVEPGCEKSARDKTGKCKAHGGGARCPNCITWPDSRSGSKDYDGYCATCFKIVFPHDERSKVIYTHTKEIRVRNTINEEFEGFIHDRPLYTGHCDCTMRRRIDHRKLIGATLLCIETDEFAHVRYDQKDEEIRYDDLFMVHSGKWVFIRFNPDGKGVDMEDKLARLVEEIHEQIKRIENEENTELLEVVKLFYPDIVTKLG
jgi:hypothetical protein